MTQAHSFKKDERIFLQREIDLVFNEGISFISYPLRVVYVEQDAKTSNQASAASVLISVPKRKIKHAVDRNRIKRLIRETYRLNKNPLLDFLREQNKSVLIAFLFVGNDVVDYKTTELAMQKALRLLIEKLS